MSEESNELEQELAAFVRDLRETTQQAGDTVVEQWPVFVDQLFTWHAFTSALWTAVGVLLIATILVFWVRFIIRFQGKGPHRYDDAEELGFLASGVGSLFLVAIGIAMIGSNLDWLQIWIAPKVWLVEYARDMLP